MELLMAVTLALTALGQVAAMPGPENARTSVGADTDWMDARSYDYRTRMARTHPNELWRLYGSDAVAKGNWGDAMRHYRKAARYADKYSQHRISLLYWHGAGVDQDRAMAYAWADLAAERRYPTLIALREKMWESLDESERQRALQVGEAIYAEFGDRVAKPRLEREVWQARRKVTGSRTGFNDAKIQVDGPSGAPGFTGDAGNFDLTDMFSRWRMDPDRYWAAEDAIWNQGNVEVGPAQIARDADR